MKRKTIITLVQIAVMAGIGLSSGLFSHLYAQVTIDRVELDGEPRPGDTLGLTLTGENLNVDDTNIALFKKIVKISPEIIEIKRIITVTDTTIKFTIQIPSSFQPGIHHIQIGIVISPEIAVFFDKDIVEFEETMDFDSVEVYSSQSKTFTIQNSGTDALIIDSLKLKEPKLPGFELIDTIAIPDTIAVGDSKTFTIRFKPASDTIYIDTLRIYSNAANADTFTFQVKGEGTPIPPDVTVPPILKPEIAAFIDKDIVKFEETIDFDAVKVDSSLSKPFTIQNTGRDALIIDSLILKEQKLPGFELIDTILIPDTIAVGDSTTFTIRFKPASDTIYIDTLRIYSNAANAGTFTFQVSGTGVSPIISISKWWWLLIIFLIITFLIDIIAIIITNRDRFEGVPARKKRSKKERFPFPPILNFEPKRDDSGSRDIKIAEENLINFALCLRKFEGDSDSCKIEVKDKGPLLHDLTLIEGIGPRISALLQSKGISTFEDLAKTEVDRLKQILKDAETLQSAQLHPPDTWPGQAGLAAAKKWNKLRQRQEELKGGRKPEKGT
jgi:hypothetical protein